MIRIVSREQLMLWAGRSLDSTFGTPAPDHFQLVEIGPSEEYDRVHLTRAVHLSDAQLLNTGTIRSLLPDHGQQIVLYGSRARPEAVWDAARRLEVLGYLNLFIYDAGKEDWIDTGLDTQTSIVPADRLPHTIVSPPVKKAA